MSFIKKHMFLSAILFLIPVIIGIILRLLDCCSCIHVTASDWITLLAGLFTYYGTVILAVVTVSQNDKLIEFQERQERREQLQDEREERQERREERQEKRDEVQQGIASKQLEISKRQEEIADRQLKYVEREQEITETILRNENQPNFEISSVRKLVHSDEIPVELIRQIYIRGYDHEFKAWMEAEKDSNDIYIFFENKSGVDAYEVSIVEVEPKFWFEEDKVEYKDQKERQNAYYHKLFITTFERIPAGDGKVMTYVLSKDEESFAVRFTITFRNAYQHWFYQNVIVCMGRENDKIECQLQINDSRQGKKEINENGIVQFADGKFLSFPPNEAKEK